MWSILLYAVSAFMSGYSTSVGWLLFWRCGTFVGVCVEFVAAVAWLSELFPNAKQRESVIGWTQAFASVGGLVVTGANAAALKYASSLPAFPVPEPFDPHAFWRYTLLTGLVPGVLILLMMPFVPESQSWLER